MEILENCDHIKGIVLSPWLVGNNVSLQWKKMLLLQSERFSNRLFCTCVCGNPHLMSGLLEKMKKKHFFFVNFYGFLSAVYYCLRIVTCRCFRKGVLNNCFVP